MSNCFGVYEKWPDVLEVWKENEDDLGEIKFVLIRRNNRALQTDQMTMLRLLEAHGLNVVVRVGTVELTLDQFEKGLGFVGINNTRVLAQSTLYNKKAELKRFCNILERMELTDPHRESVIQRINALNEQLGLNDPEVNPDALKRSNDALNKLIEKFKEDEFVVKPPDEWTDDELAKMQAKDLPRATGVKGDSNNPEWVKLLARWSKALRAMETTSNEQPTIQDQSDITKPTRAELDRVDPTPAQSPNGETLGREEHVNPLPTKGV